MGVLNPQEKPNKTAPNTKSHVDSVETHSIMEIINVPQDNIKIGIRPYLSELLAKNNLTIKEAMV